MLVMLSRATSSVADPEPDSEGSETFGRIRSEEISIDPHISTALRSNVGHIVSNNISQQLHRDICAVLWNPNRNHMNRNFLPCGTGTVGTVTVCRAEPEPEP
jgi:hypothetical protein